MGWKWITPIATLVLLLCAYFFGAFGPDVESTVFPVIKEMRIVDVSRDSRMISFYWEYDKVRDCPLVTARFYVAPNSTLARIQTTVINEFDAPAGTIQRPMGPGKYGPFKFVTPVLGYDGPFKLSGELLWSCHIGWLTAQTFVFNMPGLDKK